MAEPPALLITGLAFAYQAEGPSPEERFDLRVASLAIAQGEQVLLTAHSGGGKSTLLSLIAGLIDPDAGSVRIADQDIHALHGAARDRFRGRHVGMIFQTFNLLAGFTALENVLAALMFSDIPHRDHEPRARGLLTRLGITRPGALVERLSLGQQQRVAVARAVACDPVLVLADEPTASLDPDNALAAIDLIQQACAENRAALLCVSHDPSMAVRFMRRESLTDLRGTGGGA
jgi:ABC-type lipoprotein export system ATPase subunit